MWLCCFYFTYLIFALHVLKLCYIYINLELLGFLIEQHFHYYEMFFISNNTCLKVLLSHQYSHTIFLLPSLPPFSLSLCLSFIHSPLERTEGREKDRVKNMDISERETPMGCLPHATSWGLIYNPEMCSHQESNWKSPPCRRTPNHLNHTCLADQPSDDYCFMPWLFPSLYFQVICFFLFKCVPNKQRIS